MMIYKNNPAVHAQASGTPGSKIQLNIFQSFAYLKKTVNRSVGSIRQFDERFNHLERAFRHSVEVINHFETAFKCFVKAINRFEETINQFEGAFNHFEEAFNPFEEAIKYNLLYFNTLQRF